MTPLKRNHLAALLTVFDEFGIEIVHLLKIGDNGTQITIEVGDPKVTGYKGFRTTFWFDQHDKFDRVDLWEE